MNHQRNLILLLLLSVLLAVSSHAASADSASCVDGSAAGYPCENINLVAHLPLDQIGGAEPVEACAPGGQVDACASDLWGWTTPTGEREFLMVGLRDGTSFVEVTDPYAPVYIGKLPSAVAQMSDYRDVKVYAGHAFIVGDTHPGQGMQVFDLTRLESADPADFPITFTVDAFYNDAGLEYGHNLWINEATGFGYISRSASCGGAQHMVDLSDPLNPVFAGCYDSGTNDSDAECIVYDGPDSDYTGQEICFIGSDEWVSIADVSDKAQPVTLSLATYPTVQRAHQGALTPDRRYFLVSDTMDEATLGHNTRTHVIDVQDLDNPLYSGYYEHPTPARDHNVYITDVLALETNWRAGLRVLNIGADPGQTDGWEEIAYFDTYPADDGVQSKSGAWSHYDWLDSGVIAVSDVESGLFLLQIELAPTDVVLSGFDGSPSGSTSAMLLLALGVALAMLGAARLRRPATIR